MPNVLGQSYALMTLSAIIPGREDALREYLAALPVGGKSPLAKLGQTHFARWLIVSRLLYQGPPQVPDELRNAYLLFTSDFDGSLESYLDGMCNAMAAETDAIWGHCVAYPGSADRAAFGRYMRHNQIETTLTLAPYPEATVAEVRDALALRIRLGEFAIRAQTMSAGELREAYQRELADAAPATQA